MQHEQAFSFHRRVLLCRYTNLEKRKEEVKMAEKDKEGKFEEALDERAGEISLHLRWLQEHVVCSSVCFCAHLTSQWWFQAGWWVFLSDPFLCSPQCCCCRCRTLDTVSHCRRKMMMMTGDLHRHREPVLSIYNYRLSRLLLLNGNRCWRTKNNNKKKLKLKDRSPSWN